MRFNLILAALVILAASALPARAAELVMYSTENCAYCMAWDRDVGVVYDKTPEGVHAPLRRLDIDDDTPDDFALLEPVKYAPTFVLIESGQELGRITGYPGEEFFWWKLGELIKGDQAGKI